MRVAAGNQCFTMRVAMGSPGFAMWVDAGNQSFTIGVAMDNQGFIRVATGKQGYP